MADEAGTENAGNGGAEAGAGSGGGAAGALAAPAAGAGAAAQGGSWLDTLPDDLKADATISRFKSIDELARGHIEAHKVAKSKVPMPGDSDESFNAFAVAIRPETADAYKIDVPEGQSTEYADAMRGVFHEAGLHPRQVEIIVAGNNARAEALLQQADQAVQAFQAERGAGYPQELAQVQGMMTKLGVDEKIVSDAEKALGTNGLMSFMWGLAEMTGELKRVDGDPSLNNNINGMSLEQAEARSAELMKSADWRDKINKNDPAALAEHNQLIARIAQLKGQRK
jgi:hypothetical protein